MFDRQIPLLRIGQATRIDGPIDRRILAVQEPRIEERRGSGGLRRPRAQGGRRNKNAPPGGKKQGGGIAGLRYASAPSRDSTRVDEDAVSEPHDRLIPRRVSDAEARREGLIVSLFGVSPSETRRPGLVAGEGQTPGPVARRRVQPHRIEEGGEIVFLVRRRDALPPQAVIETEFRSHPP